MSTKLSTKRCAAKAYAAARRAGSIGSKRHREKWDLTYFACMAGKPLGRSRRRRKRRR